MTASRTETAAEAPALTGWQLGFFGQNLGKVTREPTPFTTTAAELTALENGQLDAAWVSGGESARSVRSKGM